VHDKLAASLETILGLGCKIIKKPLIKMKMKMKTQKKTRNLDGSCNGRFD